MTSPPTAPELGERSETVLGLADLEKARRAIHIHTKQRQKSASLGCMMRCVLIFSLLTSAVSVVHPRSPGRPLFRCNIPLVSHIPL